MAALIAGGTTDNKKTSYTLTTNYIRQINKYQPR